MAIRYEQDNDDNVYYFNNGKRIRIYYGDILSVAFVARDWHGGQSSALYALSSSGTPDPRILMKALREFNSIKVNESELTEEEYEDYISAVDTLGRIVSQIEELEN